LFSANTNTQLKIINSEGALLKSINITGKKSIIGVSELAPGLYFLNVSDSDGHSATYRFSKQ